jgi:hypothetical protein
LAICACYSGEMALNAHLVGSVENMLDWEEMREKGGEVIGMKTYVARDKDLPLHYQRMPH